MKANVGDFLVVKGTTTERHDQHAEIIAVRSQDGSPPYVGALARDRPRGHGVSGLRCGRGHRRRAHAGGRASVSAGEPRGYVAAAEASRPQGGAHQHHAVGRPPRTRRLRESSRCRPRLLTGGDAGPTTPGARMTHADAHSPGACAMLSRSHAPAGSLAVLLRALLAAR